MPLVDLPDAALVSLMVLVWFAAAIVTDIWLTRRLSSLHTLFMLLGAQAVFSLVQATTNVREGRLTSCG